MFSAFQTRRTTADVMSVFSRTLADLRSVEQEHVAEAKRQEEEVSKALAAHQAACAEAQLASDTARKLESLLNPGVGDAFALAT